jgi:hypothetical protein
MSWKLHHQPAKQVYDAEPPEYECVCGCALPEEIPSALTANWDLWIDGQFTERDITLYPTCPDCGRQTKIEIHLQVKIKSIGILITPDPHEYADDE